ncbi:hypothetical protein [Saccharicrinis sp. 156]|uniref:hypothetical protein n=1 Tax=Saccharicrinis sp. 156 TaxID=3417574 RepID=UPI003D3454C9
MNKDITRQILKQVEKKFNRGRGVNWKNRDFEDLSFSVHQQTKVLISVATLKRIFGKVKTDANYSPQESTLEALANYTEFDFTTNPKKSSVKYIWYLVPLLIIVIGFFYTISFDNNKTLIKNSPIQATIQLVKTEGNCPTTAYFDLEIQETQDSVFIDFGDNSEFHQVNHQKAISHFYAYPGQFEAKLRSRGEVIARSDKILVKTNGWQAFTYYYFGDYNAETRKRYYPVPLEKAVKSNVFHVSPKTISSLGIDTTEIISVRLDNYKKTGINGDLFTYKARLKTSSFWPAVRCYSTYVVVVGTSGEISFKFVGEGCSTYSSYGISEIKRTGLEEDLSSLVVNRNEWFDVEITNQSKNVQLLVNNKEVFAGEYKNSIGEIVGTTVEFHGSGSVDHVKLFVEEECVFDKDF